MKTKIIIPICLFILISACHDADKGQAGTEKKSSERSLPVDSNLVRLSAEQVRNAGLVAGLPEQRQMHTTLRVSGVIDVPPQNIISVSVPLGGYLKKTTLIPGEKVSKGSVLATLEDQQYIQLQQDYLTARSRLQYLEADYARQKGLNETKATSDKIFQQVQADFNSQKILARSLAEKLRLIGISPESLTEDNISRSICIYAPIGGYVTKVNVNIGKYVNPTDVLFELVNPDDLHLRLTVFENDATRLSVGQKIVCFTNSRPDVKYFATIHFITPNIGEDRSTDVHCHLDRYSKSLFPGMFMNAAIELDNASVTAVPEDAVVKWENKYYLFTAESENEFKMLPVETGAKNNGYIEIKSGLPAKKIITRNAYTLLMKLKNSGEES